MPSLMNGIDNLPDTVAFQAKLCGAEFTIEDLGGEAIFAINPLCGPSGKSDTYPPLQEHGHIYRPLRIKTPTAPSL